LGRQRNADDCQKPLAEVSSLLADVGNLQGMARLGKVQVFHGAGLKHGWPHPSALWELEGGFQQQRIMRQCRHLADLSARGAPRTRPEVGNRDADLNEAA